MESGRYLRASRPYSCRPRGLMESLIVANITTSVARSQQVLFALTSGVDDPRVKVEPDGDGIHWCHEGAWLDLGLPVEHEGRKVLRQFNATFIEPDSSFHCWLFPFVTGQERLGAKIFYGASAVKFAHSLLAELKAHWPELQVALETRVEPEVEGLLRAKAEPEDELVSTGRPNPGRSSEPRRERNRGPWDDTQVKLRRLEELRLKAMRDRVRLSWIRACQLAGIDPRTAAKHDPELRKHWSDTTWSRAKQH